MGYYEIIKLMKYLTSPNIGFEHRVIEGFKNSKIFAFSWALGLFINYDPGQGKIISWASSIAHLIFEMNIKFISALSN